MLRVRSSSPYGRVIDIVVIGLVAALIAIFFTHDGTAIRLLRYAPAASRRRGLSSNTLVARARHPGQSDTPPFERQRNDRPVSPLTFEDRLPDVIPAVDRCSGKGWPCSSGRANHFLCEFPFQAANWRPEVTSKRGRKLLRCGVGTLLRGGETLRCGVGTLICGRGMLMCGMLTGPALATPPVANANVPTFAK